MQGTRPQRFHLVPWLHNHNIWNWEWEIKESDTSVRYYNLHKRAKKKPFSNKKTSQRRVYHWKSPFSHSSLLWFPLSSHQRSLLRPFLLAWELSSGSSLTQSLFRLITGFGTPEWFLNSKRQNPSRIHRKSTPPVIKIGWIKKEPFYSVCVSSPSTN